VTSAAAVGRKVLTGFEKGRQRAIEAAQARSQGRAKQILDLAAADVLAGNPSRGRAGRICRKMGREISESQVRRHLKLISRRLLSVRGSLLHNGTQQEDLCIAN
jgi:hypothetical protein